ncbi:MAG: PIN domain-containing protein, partial [Chloroflexi bacterium]|nr:PIN domain-containing protein [Chloroflexota bacterium]
NGSARVGLPWQSLTAFLRIVTHPRALDQPMRPSEAWGHVDRWLRAPTAWVPTATDQHAIVLAALIERHEVAGNLVMDAHLAALAIEHGVALASADTDFARFPEVRWVNPIVD